MSRDYDLVEEPQGRASMSRVAALIWLGVFAFAGFYFYEKSDWIALISTGIVLVTAFLGFWLGFSRIAASLVGLLVGVVLSPSLAVRYENVGTDWLQTTGLINRGICMSAIGLVVALLTTALLACVARRTIDHRAKLSWSDRWLGFFVGGFQGFALFMFCLGAAVTVGDSPLFVKAKRADFPAFVISTKAQTEASHVGPIVDKYNPFKLIPQLESALTLQGPIQLAANPQAVHDIVNHPKLQALSQRPEFKDTLEELLQDPKIGPYLKSETGTPPKEMLGTLLASPAVLKLLDSPEVRKTIQEVIDSNPNSMSLHSVQ